MVMALGLCLTGPALPQDSDSYAQARAELIDAIAEHVRETSLYLGRERLDDAVLGTIAQVPRHEFVPEHQRVAAYENRPLPIGHGQTISQPYIVAIMTDLLDLKADDKALEIGTGSGYQAAILATLVDEVYSIEIIEPLATAAERRLQRLGYDNVHTRIGDGYFGWESQAPFDAIVVTAAANHVPPPLLKQLAAGGRMIIPVGSRFLTQQLLLISKDADGELHTRQILPVRFVPLTGDH
jgi:protein-L-isoaspartate(D-aspartate) O-methyltransferase